MNGFIDSLNGHLDAMATEMGRLPDQLREAVENLDRHRLGHLFLTLEQEYDKLVVDEESARKAYSPGKELALSLLDPALGKQMSKLKEPSDVRIIIGKGEIKAVAISKLARQCRVTTLEVAGELRQQGYKVFGWNQYQKLLYEIGKLIGGDEEQGENTEPTSPIAIGVPVHPPPQGVKILPKSSPS